MSMSMSIGSRSRSNSVSLEEDSREDQEQKGDVGGEVEDVRSRAKIFLKSLAMCLAGTAAVASVPAAIANLGLVGCEAGIVLNEFNCSTEAVVGLASVGVPTALVSMGAYYLQRALVKRLSGQQQPQDIESLSGSDSTTVQSRDSRFSSESLPDQERSASQSSDVDASSEQDLSKSASA
jgi:hypothetical protein